MKGSIRKRGTTWSYSFELAQIAGKRKRIEKGGFRTKALAESALAKAIAEYNSCGQYFEPSELSFSDFCDYWLENVARKEMLPQSYKNAETNTRNHIKKQLGQYKLKALTPAVLQEWANDLVKKNMVAQTNRNIFAFLSRILKYAVHPMQYIKFYPMEFVKLPRQPNIKKVVQVISDNDYAKILELCPLKNRYRISIVIAYNTGYRNGEACGLDWSEIDLVNKVIHLQKQLISYNKNWVIGSLKTTGSVRDTKIGNVLLNELRQQRQWQLENRMYYGKHYIQAYKVENNGLIEIHQQPISQPVPPNWERIDLVNTKENGELCTTRATQENSRRIAHTLGIPFHFHMLRHTHATKLIEGGASIKAIQNRLGHSNLTTTANTYLHDTEKMEDEAVKIFESCLPQNKSVGKP